MTENYIETDKIKEYFDNPAISQSDLIALSKSPYIFKKKKDNKDTYTSDALTLGSAVDCLLTDIDNWGNRFYVLTSKKPTGQMLEFTENLANLSDRITDSSNNEKAAYDIVGFKRDSFEKVIDRFEKEGREYYNELVISKNKTSIDFEIYEQALKIKEDFLNSKYTKEYFICNEDEDIHFQTSIYFKYESVDCKALIDVIKINHKNKTVTPIDVKTTEFLPNFEDSFWKYRYDLQSAWYLLAINLFNESFGNESFGIDKSYSNYTILPFRFIVAEKCCGHKPWVFKVSHNALNTGRDGGTVNGKQYKGYKQLIEEYKVCKSKEQWDYPVELLKDTMIQI